MHSSWIRCPDCLLRSVVSTLTSHWQFVSFNLTTNDFLFVPAKHAFRASVLFSSSTIHELSRICALQHEPKHCRTPPRLTARLYMYLICVRFHAWPPNFANYGLPYSRECGSPYSPKHVDPNTDPTRGSVFDVQHSRDGQNLRRPKQ